MLPCAAKQPCPTLEMYTDSKLAEMMVHGTEAERAQALKHFFTDPRNKKAVIGRILAQGGQKQDAEEAFQKGFLAFNRKVRAGAFRGGSLRSFLQSTCFQYWLDRKKNKHYASTVLKPELPDEEAPQSLTDSALLENERRQALETILAQHLGEDCQKILLLPYRNYKDTEISAMIGSANPQQIRKARLRCMNRLKNKIEAIPHLKTFLNRLRYE